MANPVLRVLWMGLGFLSVGVGVIGIVVPGLPTTVFFVIAAACFSRSSPRFEQWVLDLPTVGPLVRDYRAGLGMPKRAKIAAVTSIVVVCSLSAFVAADRTWLRLLILAAGAVGVAWILWRIPTRVVPLRPDEVEAMASAHRPLGLPGRVFRVAAFAEAATWVGLLAACSRSTCSMAARPASRCSAGSTASSCWSTSASRCGPAHGCAGAAVR